MTIIKIYIKRHYILLSLSNIIIFKYFLPDLKPLPGNKYRKKGAVQEWDSILQSRLADDLKYNEFRQVNINK